MKLLIIHPGIQHAPHLANGAFRSNLFETVTLYTTILFKPRRRVFGLLKRRVKPIDKGVKIVNHYIYTILFNCSRYLYNKVFANPHNQSHNNPIYFWQQVFGYLCLPHIYLNRKNILVACFETAAWPIVKYCKKWDVPVIMDFASISHEKAKNLGINETGYGITLKLKERQKIDYAFYCSKLCKASFTSKTSSKKDYLLYLGADKKNNKLNINARQTTKKIKLSFIANLEYRKGLDILLDAFTQYKLDIELEVHFIGKLRKEWINNYLIDKIVPDHIKFVFQPAISQNKLFIYLSEQNFDLNIQPSRFDSFAMVVPETMMLGIPNLVSPYVGAGELIINNVSGFVMDTLNAKTLINILEDYILTSEALKSQLKLNTLKASELMTWDNYYVNLEKAFKNVLDDIKKI